ncbi:hypothetical protein SAMN04487926_1361 [Paraburkholderia steynii]|uniref:Uncharacterized protein n=1 Tax=Paraburkholderia steynii TaxID=1245441 RepID=A0A7Z7FN80_9BURK|nr:hypothetical protein SAMN04487926_1361 [Paraburkholderia steynii]
MGALRQGERLAVLAAFFCLLFFAAAKKSRCRPAQGRRVKQANASRMPAKTQANQTAGAANTSLRMPAQYTKHRPATPESRRQTADTSAKAKRNKPTAPRRRQRGMPEKDPKPRPTTLAPHGPSPIHFCYHPIQHSNCSRITPRFIFRTPRVRDRTPTQTQKTINARATSRASGAKQGAQR